MGSGTQEQKLNAGLLVIRLGLAAQLILLFGPRLIQGKPGWKAAAANLGFLNLALPPEYLGLGVAALSLAGAACLAAGSFFRLACLLMAALQVLFFLNYLHIHYQSLSLYAMAAVAVYLGLLMAGPGRFAVGVKVE